MPYGERITLNVPPDVRRLIEQMLEERGGTITSTVVGSVRLRHYFDERLAEGWRPALVKGDTVREVVLP